MTTNGKATGVKAGDGRLSAPFLLLTVLPGPSALIPGGTVLAALGLSIHGARRFLVHETVVDAEETTWGRFLITLADRIQGTPLLICCDGNPALLKAIPATYPHTAVQISLVHRLGALARSLDGQPQTACLVEARRIFSAPTREAAVARFREWRTRWRIRGRSAVCSLETDIASCLNFYRFPRNLWRRIRTVNLVRREFQAVRRPNLLGVATAIDNLAGIAAAAQAATRNTAAAVDARYGAVPVEEDAAPPRADASTVLLGVRS